MIKKGIKIIVISIFVLITIFVIIRFQIKTNRTNIYEQYSAEYTRIVTNIINETKSLSIEDTLSTIQSEKYEEDMKDLKNLVDKCKTKFNSSSENITFYHNSIKKQYDELNFLFDNSLDIKRLEDILTKFRVKNFYNEKL